MKRTEKTIKTYENVALKIFPAIIIVAGITVAFSSSPNTRASCIAIIAFFIVFLALDNQALKRMKVYQQELERA